MKTLRVPGIRLSLRRRFGTKARGLQRRRFPLNSQENCARSQTPTQISHVTWSKGDPSHLTFNIHVTFSAPEHRVTECLESQWKVRHHTTTNQEVLVLDVWYSKDELCSRRDFPWLTMRSPHKKLEHVQLVMQKSAFGQMHPTFSLSAPWLPVCEKERMIFTFFHFLPFFCS